MTYSNYKRADEDGLIGKGIKFERIRRITGYLVGTISRWNNAKKKELKDRVKHMKNNEKSI